MCSRCRKEMFAVPDDTPHTPKPCNVSHGPELPAAPLHSPSRTLATVMQNPKSPPVRKPARPAIPQHPHSHSPTPLLSEKEVCGLLTKSERSHAG